MKTIGILGGVGPSTTSKIYLSIIDLIRKKGGAEYPPIVIYNMPFPFIIEKEVIIQGINAEKMVPYLIEGAKKLESCGVDFGILPCNTLHKYIEKIRESVKFPFLSILDETILILKSRKIKKIGILATETTIKSKIYEDALIKNGIDSVYPVIKNQIVINNLIIELLNGITNDSQKKKLEMVCDALCAHGAEVIILACTDLQLVASGIQSLVPIIDTTEVIINSSVMEMMSGI